MGRCAGGYAAGCVSTSLVASLRPTGEARPLGPGGAQAGVCCGGSRRREVGVSDSVPLGYPGPGLLLASQRLDPFEPVYFGRRSDPLAYLQQVNASSSEPSSSTAGSWAIRSNLINDVASVTSVAVDATPCTTSPHKTYA